MRLKQLGVDRELRTVVILGAGASAGARLTTSAPLGRVFVDGDFFEQLQFFAATAEDARYRSDAREFLKYLAEQYGHGRHGLEAIFAELDVTRQFTDVTYVARPGRRRREFEHRVELLTTLIVRTLRYSIGATPEQLPNCDRHEALLSKLGVEDAVVSINYDLLADRALLAGVGPKFRPLETYGFRPEAIDDAWVPPVRAGRPFRNHVKLLKPHGSLNWETTGAGSDSVRIGQDETTVPPGSVALVPPQYLKHFATHPYDSIWKETRGVLREARALVIAGYSLPPSDIFTSAALRLEVQKLGLVCIANPDPVARQRILGVLRSAIDSETVVVFFDSFAQLAERMGAKSDSDFARERESSWIKPEILRLIRERTPSVIEEEMSRAMLGLMR